MQPRGPPLVFSADSVSPPGPPGRAADTELAENTKYSGLHGLVVNRALCWGKPSGGDL